MGKKNFTPKLGIKVRNMMLAKGREVPNQFEIFTDEGVYFQSYSSIIAFRSNCGHGTFLDKNKWDYSVTTGKYRNQFLGESIAKTRRKIESGIYKLVDLNCGG